MSDQNKNYREKIDRYKEKLKKLLEINKDINKQIQNDLEKLQRNLGLDDRGVSLAYSSLGYEFYNQDLLVATILFKRAIQLYKNPSAHAGYGYILYDQGKRKEAIKEWEIAKKLFQEQEMYFETEKIEAILRYITENDNWWKKLKIVLHIDSYSEIYQAKDEQIILYRQDNDILEKIRAIVRDNRPMQNIINVIAQSESKSVSESYTSKYDQRDAKIQFVDTAESGSNPVFTQNNSTREQNKKTLAEAAAEIQDLLKQLEQNNPTATESEQITHINDETTPKFKRRVTGALQAAGETAIDEFILENKYLKVAKAAIKGWLEPSS